MDDLKPCPFCGGDADIERVGNRHYSTIVACTQCGARLENGETWGHGRAWNTRSPELAAEVILLRKALQDIADGMGETSLSEIGRFAPAVARAALKGTE